MTNKQYLFEQDRKIFCTQLAYVLRNPDLSNEDRQQILSILRQTLEDLLKSKSSSSSQKVVQHPS
jgi:hypothetical protein